MAISEGRRRYLSAQMLIGLEEIAAYMHWSLRKTKSRVRELENSGVLFTMKMGRPPRPVYCTITSVLNNWICLKAEKREPL